MTLPVVLLFLKAPQPGKVKTRLAADIGNQAAVEVYRRLAEQQIERIPPNWQLRILFDPPDAEMEMTDWLGNTRTYYPQSDGDLGDRLRAGVEQAFTDGAEQVMCIGADCPTLTEEYFLMAQRLLSANTDLVVIPAEDGGYVLLAMKRLHPYLFHKITWSQPTTLEETVKRAAELNLTVDMLEPHFDIDTVNDLERAIQTECFQLSTGVRQSHERGQSARSRIHCR